MSFRWKSRFSFNDIGGKTTVCRVYPRDITERRRAEGRGSRALMDHAAQIATGTPLAEILDGVVRAVEGRRRVNHAASCCSDDSGKHNIQLGAAPSLPAFTT